MGKWLLVLSLGVTIASASTALAQPGPGGRGGPGGGADPMRRLQAEIDKLQAEIKELEARSKKGKEPAARGDDRRPQPKGELGGGPGGFSGFAPPKGRDGVAPKGGPGGGGGSRGGFAPMGGPGGFAGQGRGFRGGFGSDSKSLQTQLDHLHAASKMIDARTKEVEAQLKLAKANEARQDERRAGPPSDRGPKGKGRPDATETKPSSDIEGRLDRIEKVLEELQKSLRQKR